VAALALALGAAGCFTGAQHEGIPVRPVIRAFTASPGTILPGGTSSLSWSVTGATSLFIGSGVGDVTGTTSRSVTPAVTTTYVLTATNAGGSSTASVTVTLSTPPSPPAGLTYSANPAVYTVGTAIPSNIPSSTGGAITSYTVSPTLPLGLSIGASTGIVSGTPTAATARAVYTVTGTNSAGSTTAALTLTVTTALQPPAGLTYSANPAVYTVGTAITPNLPSSTGGAIASYAVSPALPSGLSLDTSTGIVAGTPTAAAAQAVYTVTGTNGSGSTTAPLTLTVNVVSGPPAGLRYATNPASYATGTAIAPNAPSSTGGTIAAYAVTPTLPAGLSLHPTTGVISGTPTAAAAQAVYTITGTNPQGSTSANLTLTVTATPTPPTLLTYSANPVTYPTGVAITPNRPANTGGAIDTYAVLPALPAGLVLDTTTGIIAGTPTAATAQAPYVITGTNGAGSTTVAVVITVTFAPVPPSGLVYSEPAPTYSAGTAIFPNFPSSTGGAIAAYSVSPALPAGLSLDPVTGIVTGTPAAPSALATYTVTGTNGAGSTTAGIAITVVGPPVITAHPVAASAVPPATASFTVAATGSGVLAYQWQRNGTIVAGANQATYVTPATAGSDNGSTYRVVVTDEFGGMVTSNGATLTTQGFSYTGSMVVARDFHTATLLPSGKVLLAGGSDGATTLASAELFDPLTGTFTATGSMGTPRQQHTAAPLADGKVLIAGGFSSATATLATAEVYDPVSGTFSPTSGPMTEARQRFAAVPLAGGNVLLAGGQRIANPTPVPLASAETYDATTGTFTAAGSLGTARSGPEAVLLPDGTVLVAGGYSGAAYLGTALIYDPSTRLFTPTGPMTFATWSGTATLLLDGRVLVAGGQAGFNTLNAVDLFTAAGGGTFAATGSMGSQRAFQSASLLPGGKVVMAGGTNGATIVSSAEFYDPATGTFADALGQGLNGARYRQTATGLLDGRVLVAGGNSGVAGALRSAEIWTNVP
jgi:hypothetical protein